MKERKPFDLIWNNNRLENTRINQILADRVLYHGHYWRATVSARKLFQYMLKGENVRNINPAT